MGNGNDPGEEARLTAAMADFVRAHQVGLASRLDLTRLHLDTTVDGAERGLDSRGGLDWCALGEEREPTTLSRVLPGGSSRQMEPWLMAARRIASPTVTRATRPFSEQGRVTIIGTGV
jgi:hypothetical protein